MSRIKQLRQKKADTLAKVRAISAKAETEGRDLTDDEREQSQALMKAVQAINADLEVEEQLLNEERSMGTVADLNQPTEEERRERAAAVSVRDRAEDDPKRGFRDHKDFLHAVMDAGMGRKVDARLQPLRATQGSDEQGEYSAPHGGFLVPSGVAPGILSIAPEDDPVAALTTKPPMRAPTVSFNARVDKDHSTSVSGGLVVTRRPETVDGTSSRMKFEQVTLTANELFGLAFASERIITDSPESFVAILAAGFRDEYADKGMEERLHGSGTGEPLGVLHDNNGCLVTITKETGQTADTIVKENLDKMVARCWRYMRAVWLASMDTLPQLSSIVQVVGTGGNAVPYLKEAPGGGFMLNGRPLYFTENCKKLGDKGDIILGNWSEYLEGEYQPMRSDESIHVRFAAGERCFRFFKRNDGQPWWRTAMTPKNGQPSLSPFVTLGAR